MKKALLIFLAGVGFGCATTDTARRIQRQCPVKRVYGVEASKAVLKGPEYKGGKVPVMDSCYWNAQAICNWANSNGLPCTTKTIDAEYRGKIIKNGHVTVAPVGSKYYLDYVDYLGIVRRKK